MMIDSMVFSEVESNRFGMRICRATYDEINNARILDDLVKTNADIAIIRIPSRNQHQISRLNELKIDYINADTLVYYSCDLTKHIPNLIKNDDLEFVKCDYIHFDIINDLIERIFLHYTNHYFSNPYMELSKINEGYKEWARGYIGHQDQGRISWLVKKNNDFVGFATCSFDNLHNECEGVLYGVVPEYSGKGIYGDIIRFTQNYFKEKEYKLMKVSTQIQNYAVQKVWTRENFTISNSYCTIHINSFLSHSKETHEVIEFTIHQNYIETHRLDKAKLRHEFSYQDIVTEYINLVNSLTTNYVNSKYSGNVINSYNCSFSIINPLRQGVNYKIQISVPFLFEESKMVVVQIRQEETIYGLAYYDFKLSSN